MSAKAMSFFAILFILLAIGSLRFTEAISQAEMQGLILILVFPSILLWGYIGGRK